MSCPSPNPNPDAPIGSPILGDPCSPCFDAKPEDFFKQFQALQANVCSLETRLNNMYQLFGRTRNRLTKVENDLNNLPSDEEAAAAVGCAGLESTGIADAVLVCEDGSEKAFVPAGIPEKIVFCGGQVKKVPKGLEFYPLVPKQLVLNVNIAGFVDVPANLPSFPTDVCGPIWAIFESLCQAHAGVSGTGSNVHLTLNGYSLCTAGFFGDWGSGQSMAPVTTSNITFHIEAAGNGVKNASSFLIGYMY